jgi:hypothetical protein
MTVVVWHDAHSTLEELNEQDIQKGHKPNVIHTSGYLVVEDADGISIAGEWLPANKSDTYETYRNITFIPRPLVQSVGTVKRSKKAATRGQLVDPPGDVGGTSSPPSSPDSQPSL